MNIVLNEIRDPADRNRSDTHWHDVDGHVVVYSPRAEIIDVVGLFGLR
ncbi:MAG: hypothetical protein HY048_11645 [Acidobacteria bacterium]|nr:hypothetical protein [Acidobacteriota bacterium]